MSQENCVNSVRTREIDSPNRLDGGVRAWSAAVASFFCQSVIGLNYCYAVFYSDIFTRWNKLGIPDAFGKTAFVGSLATGLLFLASSAAGIIDEKIGTRFTTTIGCFITSLGLFLSTFCMESVIGLSVSYGVLVGLGGALIFAPTSAVLGRHFDKYLGIVNGVVMTGMTFSTIIMPYSASILMEEYGIRTSFRVLSAYCFLLGIATLILFGSDKAARVEGEEIKKHLFSDIFDCKLFENRKYCVWVISFVVATIGSTVPYIFIVNLVGSSFGDVDKNLSVVVMGVAQLLGQVAFGIFGDRSSTKRLTLQGIALFGEGIAIISMPFMTMSYPVLLFVVMIFGVCDGGFLSVIGPITFEICEKNQAARAIGFMLTSASISITLGPSLIGILLEQSQSYKLALAVAGVPVVISSIIIYFTRFLRSPQDVMLRIHFEECLKSPQDIMLKSESGGISDSF